MPGTSATGVDLPSGESGTDGESGGVIRDMVDDVKDGMEEITTGTTGAGENGTSHGTGDGTTGQTTGGGASGTDVYKRQLYSCGQRHQVPRSPL